MSKRQLIEEIRRHNPTAQPTFLAQFEEPELGRYLTRLQDAEQNRPHIAGRIKKGIRLKRVS